MRNLFYLVAVFISFSAAFQTVFHGRKALKRVFEIEAPPKKRETKIQKEEPLLKKHCSILIGAINPVFRDILLCKTNIPVCITIKATVAEIYKAFWTFLGIASPDCSGFKNQSHFSG